MPIVGPNKSYYYGVTFDAQISELWANLFIFREYNRLANKEGTSYTGQGRLFHLQKASWDLWKKDFVWHEQAEACLDLFCDYPWSTVTGPAALGKTTAAAIYAINFWLAQPLETAVICTSTTVQGLKKRIWKEIKRYALVPSVREVQPDMNLVDSKTAIQSVKGDDAHGIFGLAVAAGQTEKALGRLIGFHPKRLLIIVDEMTDTPEAIVDACVNLSKTEGEFQFIGLGNAKSIFDPHGKMSTPKLGWSSINVDSDFWETERGGCLHIDGLKSPNIKLGKNKYPFLLKLEDVESDRKHHGEDSPKWWRFIRGFWAPQGLENLVVTETMIRRFQPNRKAEWARGFTLVAGLDPAYGGDRCTLVIARYGKGTNNKTLIEFVETFTVPINAGAAEPIHYQIARIVKEKCKDAGVRPENFAIDSTGAGAGTADILAREWSPRIQRVNFSSRASERPVSETNPRTCVEEYWNFVSELWYSWRRFLEADQLRGVSDDAAKEFCSRFYEIKGTLIAVEPKEEMKARVGYSPDIADAYAIVTELVRRLGVEIEAGGTESKDRILDDRRQQRAARRFDVDADAANYQHGNEFADFTGGSIEL